MKVTKYDVITTMTLRDMIEQINVKVFRGWEPVGQIRPHIVSSVSTTEYETFLFGEEEEYREMKKHDEKSGIHNRLA